MQSGCSLALRNNSVIFAAFEASADNDFDGDSVAFSVLPEGFFAFPYSTTFPDTSHFNEMFLGLEAGEIGGE